MLLQFSLRLLLECHLDEKDEKDVHTPHKEFKTAHSLKQTVPYSGASNCVVMLSGMIMVTNSNLALVANPNGRSTALICVSGLVTAMYIQLMLHGPQPGEDLLPLSMMMLSLRCMVVQIRCPGQVKVGREPGVSRKKMQQGGRATRHKYCKERVNKPMMKSRTNARKEEGTPPRGKHTCEGDFSKSKNDLNRDGSTSAPIEKCKWHGFESKCGLVARGIER